VQVLGDELRAKFAATKAQVLAIVRQPPSPDLQAQRQSCCACCVCLHTSHLWHFLCILLFLQALGDELRAKFAATKAQVLAIVRQQELLEDPGNGASPELDEKLRLRAPYVAPLNVLQVCHTLVCWLANSHVWCGCVWDGLLLAGEVVVQVPALSWTKSCGCGRHSLRRSMCRR
jgi:hypothetical protein